MPTDFTFDELERLLKIFGYEKSNKGKTSGSRIIYKNNEKRPIMIPNHIRETSLNLTH